MVTKEDIDTGLFFIWYGDKVITLQGSYDRDETITVELLYQAFAKRLLEEMKIAKDEG